MDIIARRWINEPVSMSNIKYLLLIECVKISTTLDKAIKVALGEDQFGTFTKILYDNSARIVILLDGLDELTCSETAFNTLITEWINERPNIKMIITTRGHKIHDLTSIDVSK